MGTTTTITSTTTISTIPTTSTTTTTTLTMLGSANVTSASTFSTDTTIRMELVPVATTQTEVGVISRMGPIVAINRLQTGNEVCIGPTMRVITKDELLEEYLHPMGLIPYKYVNI